MGVSKIQEDVTSSVSVAKYELDRLQWARTCISKGELFGGNYSLLMKKFNLDGTDGLHYYWYDIIKVFGFLLGLGKGIHIDMGSNKFLLSIALDFSRVKSGVF